MRTAVMTDTNSGITADEGRRYGVHVIPMPVLIDGRCYYEGIDITPRQLYEAMRQERSISTSQPSLGDVADMWNSILAEGYDEIVYIPMTSGLSGSCHNATLLAAGFEQRVHVADNRRISVTQRESVLEARRMAGRGVSGREIKAHLEATAHQASIYLMAASLQYLQRGGRLSPSAAMLGTLLNIKPILSIQGGKIDAYAKVRGMRQCEKKMIEALQEDVSGRFSHIPAERLIVATAGTLEDEAGAEHWRGVVQDAFPEHHVEYTALPCSIACHLGPGCMGIGVIITGEE